MCGATAGGLSLDGIDTKKEAIVQGQVLRDGEPVSTAYVRLLDRTGEFTAEVPTSATGHFRFFAGNGDVHIDIPAARCSLVTADNRRVVEPGEFALRVGPSSRREQQLSAEFRVRT